MIEFENVTMTYRQSGIKALKNVSFHIDRGEFCFIIGESGAGKSTLIKLLTREESPDSGRVSISGYDLQKLKKKQVPYLRRNIGMIFQDFRLIETKTVYENVAYAMEIVGANRRQIKRQVPLVLSTVGLRNKADMRPHELSGGEQQRVAIARAMVNSPMVILADEPTGNLDPATSESIMALLSVINKAGTTVIVCTHDRNLVDKMQRRVIEIDDGFKIRDEESSMYSSFIEELENDIDNEAIAAVLRQPKISLPFNFIHAEESKISQILEDSHDAVDDKSIDYNELIDEAEISASYASNDTDDHLSEVGETRMNEVGKDKGFSFKTKRIYVRENSELDNNDKIQDDGDEINE